MKLKYLKPTLNILVTVLPNTINVVPSYGGEELPSELRAELYGEDW